MSIIGQPELEHKEGTIYHDGEKMLKIFIAYKAR